jgi:OFA family oxalate/formate antiporter-like MFS transporter
MAKFTILKVDTILIILILMGLFNGLGRLIVSSATDRLKVKSKIYYSIMGFPILFILAHFYVPDTIPKILLVSSFMYGAGFSCLPIILREKFGIDNLSVIHGLELTAWAVAGLIGNRSGDYLLTEYGVETLLGVLLSLYSLGFILTYILIKTNYKN